MTHLLDTSAILAHFLDEPGADQVEALLAGGANVAGLAAPSWAELDRRLHEMIPDTAEAARILRHYTRSLCGFVPVDEAAHWRPWASAMPAPADCRWWMPSSPAAPPATTSPSSTGTSTWTRFRPTK